jgi:hypothetical protein
MTLWRWRIGLIVATLAFLAAATVCMVGFWATRRPPLLVGQLALLAAQLPLIANLMLTDPWLAKWREMLARRRP